MSQVSNHPVKLTIERLVSESAHVVVVENLQKEVMVFEATLTKETQYEKASETHYRETASLFRVVKVLKSEMLRVDEEIKVMKEPAYSLQTKML